ncbi:MAG: hypothetical protein ACO1TE_21845 [Prosthecobacter sp.]
MKRKIAQVLAALVLVTSLSSCYVYDDPLTWRGGYSSPAYRPGYSYRSYGYPSRSYGYSSRGYPSSRSSHHSHHGHGHGHGHSSHRSHHSGHSSHGHGHHH